MVLPTDDLLDSHSHVEARQAIELHYDGILSALGIKADDPNFKDTPKRVAKALLEVCEGLTEKANEEINQHLLRTFPTDNDNMVVVRGVDAWGVCPHHFLPVRYTIHIAYIPNGKVIGLSKLPRLAKLLAARPIMQEDLTKSIADNLQRVLQPLGVAVRVLGQHLCMQMRGVRSSNSDVVTTYLTGAYKTNQTTVEEFLRVI